MAMSYLDKVKQNQQAQAPQQAAGLQGVSQNTQQQMAKYQQGYQPTQQAQTAQQNLQTVQAQKPQGYNSKYGPMLDSIMADINDQKDFKYEFNGDEAFRYFADVYGQKGKQASMDAMGQAAALTGGYGNTFAQGAGQQAYQQYLMDLYGVGMDLRKQAQDQYNADRADLYNRLGAVQGMDESDYGRYRDTVQDYNADLDRAREDARYEDESGYQRYMDQLNYWQGLAQAENADYRAGRTQDMDEQRFAWQQDTDARDFAEAQMRADQDEAYRYATLNEQKRQADMDESFRRDNMVQSQQQFETSTKLDYDRLAEQIRQFDAGMSEDQRQYNQKMAASWVSDILSNGQIPSMDLLAMAGLSYEDAQKLIAQIQGSSGPGTKKQTTKEAVMDAVTVGLYNNKTGVVNGGFAILPSTGMTLNTDYESLAKAAADEMGRYEKGTDEYEAAQYFNNLYKNTSKMKDEILTSAPVQSPTAKPLPADVQAAQKAQQEKQAATGQTGVKMVWDSKQKKFVPAK